MTLHILDVPFLYHILDGLNIFFYGLKKNNLTYCQVL